MVDEEVEEDPMDNQIHHFDDIDSEIYLTQEEHNLFAQEDDSPISKIYSKQYQRVPKCHWWSSKKIKVEMLWCDNK